MSQKQKSIKTAPLTILIEEFSGDSDTLDESDLTEDDVKKIETLTVEDDDADFDDSIKFTESIDVKEPNNDYLESYRNYVNDFIDPNIQPEPLLMEENERLTVYPLDPRFMQVWRNFKRQQGSHWVAEEIKLTQDRVDWLKLSKKKRYFLEHILAFFAASDGIVNMNLRERFNRDIKVKEAEVAYSFQTYIENVHGETYSQLLDAFVSDPVRKDKLFKAIKTMPCIKAKGDWSMKWINSDKTFAHRLVAFAIVEGVFFCGSFASIFWLRTPGSYFLPGLIQSNEFISRDESSHTDFACILYSLLINKLKQEVVYEIIKDAVSIEKNFINEALPCRLLGMNSDDMAEYIQYVADRLLVQLGYQKLYGSKNPFKFMEKIDVDNKVNFFEKQGTSYSNPHVTNEDNNNDGKFTLLYTPGLMKLIP